MLCIIANQLIPVMRGINMFIMKFYSNSKMLVNSLDPKLLSKKVTFSKKETLFEEYVSKFANVEVFFYHIDINKNPVWTKRLILNLSATV
jgi:hypothetical protein